jgi:mannonate dehydratase
MKMTMRWFGAKYDTVSLKDIRQVAGVTGIISSLYDKLPGEVWTKEEICALKDEVESSGLSLAGIESVNIHDDIKAGLPSRTQYIENYITTLANLGEEGIHLVCYNFMPVFDWTRTELAKLRSDGTTTMRYEQSVMDTIDLDGMADLMNRESSGFLLAGWELQRMARLKELFAMYHGMNEDKIFENLKYFIESVMPVCTKYDINMAIHPDDPAWPVFGLPRIVTNRENLLRIIGITDNVHHGITLCAGSLGTNPSNDIPAIIHSLKGRIHFAHVRNLLHTAPGDFEESAHLSADGSMDMFVIMKALYDSGFDGTIRPDHGRTIWGEVCMPGYGLHDRALGASYLNGLWEAITKMSSGHG